MSKFRDIPLDRIIWVFTYQDCLLLHIGKETRPYFYEKKIEGEDIDLFRLSRGRHIAKRKDPQDRWEPDEVLNEYGMFSLDKCVRLIESRS